MWPGRNPTGKTSTDLAEAPIIYPGGIERVDFSEEKEDKAL